jgi:hypothetical protein
VRSEESAKKKKDPQHGGENDSRRRFVDNGSGEP